MISSVGPISSVDPLTGIPFSLRLQARKPRGSTIAVYKDTACTIPATLDGDAIAGWRDEISGSGIIAAQSTAINRPLLRFDAGIPSIQWDGGDDLLPFTLPVTANFTTFVLAKLTLAVASQNAYAPFLISNGLTPQKGMRMCVKMGGTEWGTYTGSADLSSGETLNTTDWNVLAISGTASASSLYRNGVFKATGGSSAGSTATASWIIGAELGSGSRNLASKIAAVLISPNTLSASDIQKTSDYLISLTV